MGVRLLICCTVSLNITKSLFSDVSHHDGQGFFYHYPSLKTFCSQRNDLEVLFQVHDNFTFLKEIHESKIYEKFNPTTPTLETPSM